MRAKPASQQRSQDKRDRILSAMDALLTKQSLAAIGVAELARKARVSPATIYQRFSNVDATASVLMELYYVKVEEWAKRPRKPPRKPLTLLEALHAIAADAWDQVEALGHIMRPAYLYSRQRPDRVGPEWTRLEKLAQAGFKAFLQQHAAEIRVENVEAAASVICGLFNLQLLGPLLHGEEARYRSLGREEFAGTLATLAWRYLAFPK